FAAFGDGRHPAILAAFQLLDANHLGPEIAQHRAAEGARDVTAEIEDANALQYACHGSPYFWSKKVLGFRKKASIKAPSSVQASCRLPWRRQTYWPAWQVPL